jgi:hypothetical protein
LKEPGGLPKLGPKPPPAGGVKPDGGVNSDDDGGLEPTVGGERLVGGLAPTGTLELEPPAVELQPQRERVPRKRDHVRLSEHNGCVLK